MLVIKLKLFSFLAIPIDARRLGENKTWRGVFVIPLGTFLGVWMTSFLAPHWKSELFASFNEQMVVGFLLGVAYVIGEFPNSYIKRLIGVSSGEMSEKYKFFQVLIDQSDSVFFCALTYFFYYSEVSFLDAILLILFGTVIHLLINFSLYMLKLKKVPY